MSTEQWWSADCSGKAEETAKDTSATSFTPNVAESPRTENDVL